MGFIRRLLSLGKKKKRNVTVPGTPYTPDEDSEAVANRLLRSSSARYAVVAETDIPDLPPIPHPINDVLQPPSDSASTTSLASSYSVRVHKRQRHTHTEFPNAYPDPGNTSNPNSSQLLRLRADPSVASLLEMWDEQGRVEDHVFSNSPEKDGRKQSRRSGSTLRQLLGDEGGDVSWADRVLQGVDDADASSTSSLPIQTPVDALPDSHFPHETSYDPGISSLEVELSSEVPSLDISDIITPKKHAATPRRASQVFGFLREKKRSVADDERPLPDLPSVFSTPDSSEDILRSHFSDTSDASIHAIPQTPAPKSSAPPSSYAFSEPHTPRPHSSSSTDPDTSIAQICAREVTLIVTAPTKVIVTAPTPRAGRGEEAGMHLRQRRLSAGRGGGGKKLPRRPSLNSSGLDRSGSYERPISRSTTTTTTTRSSSNAKSRKSKIDKSDISDPFTPVPARSRSRRQRDVETEKENSLGGGLGVSRDIPSTPLRSSSSGRVSKQKLFGARTPRSQHPELELSRELSDVGRKVMDDVRRARRGG